MQPTRGQSVTTARERCKKTQESITAGWRKSQHHGHRANATQRPLPDGRQQKSLAVGHNGLATANTISFTGQVGGCHEETFLLTDCKPGCANSKHGWRCPSVDRRSTKQHVVCMTPKRSTSSNACTSDFSTIRCASTICSKVPALSQQHMKFPNKPDRCNIGTARLSAADGALCFFCSSS